MITRTEDEIRAEMIRIEAALEKTDSRKLKHDYGRYLKRLRGELKALQNR